MPAENWTVAKRMIELTQTASWIRKMFEEGMRLAAIHGRDKIFDLSIGNPNVEPPEEFRRVLKEVACDLTPGRHGYMQNAGYTETREAVAAYLTADQGIPVGCDNVIMTVGAGGALNVIFRTILDPGDEVIIAKPYFVEYGNYLSNHFGVLVPVDSAEDFDLDIDAIEQAIRPATRAVLVNSPNNPTGRIYPASTLAALGDLLRRKTEEMGRIIYLISDEPYRRIVFDGNRVPPCPGCLREHAHRHQLFQGALARRRAHRVCGGQPGDRGDRPARGRPDPRQPGPRLHQCARFHATGGRAPAGCRGGRHPLPGEPGPVVRGH